MIHPAQIAARRGFSLRLIVSIVAVLGLLLPTFTPSPARAINKSEVDAACQDSREALDEYRAAGERFVVATQDLELANVALAEAETKEQRVRTLYDENRVERDELTPQVETQAVDLYMQTVSSSSAGLVALDKPQDAIIAREFMASVTGGGVGALADMSALESELDDLGGDLSSIVDEKTAIRDQQGVFTQQQEEATADALASYERLTDECKQLQADYEAEQARLRAEAEAKKRRAAEAAARAAASGLDAGSQVVSGFICPFTPGRTQFGDTYGAPRSGGRLHRGVDMFAPRGEPIYAVESGTVALSDHGLGGKQIMLRASSGRAYYYAHLDAFAITNGATVSQGDLVGYNGDSGNAEGTSPHLHFQIHPTGGSGVINPTPSVAAVCY